MNDLALAATFLALILSPSVFAALLVGGADQSSSAAALPRERVRSRA